MIVANARKLRAISVSHTKTDTEDARTLAGLGRADPQLLSPVWHGSEATQRALVRLKIREALLGCRIALINSTRLLLKSLGVFVSSSIKAMTFTKKVRAQLATADTLLVAELLDSIDHFNQRIRDLHVQLEALGTKQHPITQRSARSTRMPSRSQSTCSHFEAKKEGWL